MNLADYKNRLPLENTEWQAVFERSFAEKRHKRLFMHRWFAVNLLYEVE